MENILFEVMNEEKTSEQMELNKYLKMLDNDNIDQILSEIIKIPRYVNLPESKHILTSLKSIAEEENPEHKEAFITFTQAMLDILTESDSSVLDYLLHEAFFEENGADKTVSKIKKLPRYSDISSDYFTEKIQVAIDDAYKAGGGEFHHTRYQELIFEIYEELNELTKEKVLTLPPQKDRKITFGRW